MTFEELKQNKGLLVGLALVIVILLGGLIWIYGNRQPSGSVPPPVKTAAAAFSLKTENTVVKPGEKFSLTVVLATNGEKVTAADALVEFDPEKLAVLDIGRGNLFANYPVLKEKKPGLILISGLNQKANRFAPDGTMAQIEFQAKNIGFAKIAFGQKSVAGFEGRNVLDPSKCQSLTIEIKP